MTGLLIGAWTLLAVFSALTAIVTMLRYRPPRVPGANALPACSVIVPIKGSSPFLARNIRNLAGIETLRGEILLAVANDQDPALDILGRIVSEHPHKLRLLIGEASEFVNPKLRNLAKAYRASREDLIFFFDDSVQVSPGLLSEMTDALQQGASLITVAPIGRDVENLFGEVEAATCSYLTRIEMFLELFGAAAAFGNALAFRKADLEALGGLARLAEGPCEDNALSKAFRAAGKRVTLVRTCIGRTIGRRTWSDLYRRHLRWKNCAKCHDQAAFFIEPFIGGLCFNLLGAFSIFHTFGVSLWTAAGICLAGWYGLEALLYLVCGWQMRLITPLAWLMRDIIHPMSTVVALFATRVDWRGETVEMRLTGKSEQSERAKLP